MCRLLRRGKGNRLVLHESLTERASHGTHQTTDNPPQTVTNLMSNPVTRSAIGSGGLTVNNTIRRVCSLFCDEPSAGTNHLTTAPSVCTTMQRFQQFAMTMNGGSSDRGVAHPPLPPQLKT